MKNDCIKDYKRDDVVYVGFIIDNQLLVDDKLIALSDPMFKIGSKYYVKLDIKYADKLISFFSTTSMELGGLSHIFTCSLSDYVIISKNKKTIIDEYQMYLYNRRNDIDYLLNNLEKDYIL